MAIARVLLLCLVVVLTAAPAGAVDLAGSVAKLQGSAIATAATGFSRPLQQGSTILAGDRVATGADSRLRLRMNDGAIITLGSSSSITIEAWSDDATTGQAVMNVIEGVFLAASGAIARLGPDRMVVATPAATLGIRGTEVWGDASPDLLAVALLSGTGITVDTPAGRIEMTESGTGLDIVAGQALPPIKQWGPPRLQAAREAIAFADE